ncbi:cation:proton antiporter [Rhodopirellula sp. JC639]|uniref:cation:proton antiporter n=1 Tax=Stieleria mannarensis TaxID=2755585 RepID=UPI00160401F3|nr:sodium:proton antiporter [Rhodopirellula sp. JC639]
MDTVSVTIVAFGIMLFSLVSARLRDSIFTPPMVFVLFGLMVGDVGLRLFSFHFENEAIHLLAELTLILVLFTDASRIDLRLLCREHDLPIRLLTIGLPISIAVGTVFAWWLFEDFGIWQAAVLATIVAPTDAALAHAFVANKLVPARIRQSISVESGLNDGLCLPLFLVFICGARLAEHPETTGYWARFAALQISLGPLVGIGVGYLGGNLIERAAQRHWISHSFLELTTLALALVAYGAAELVGGNGFIAAFCAGLTVGTVSKAICRAIHEFAEAEGQLLTLLIFFVLGAVLVPGAIHDVSLMSVIYAIFALSVMRILPVAIALAGTRLRHNTRWLIGWFGPRGVASIVFAMILLEEYAVPAQQEIFAVALLTVMLSVFCHGLTSNPLAKLYARRMESSRHAADAAEHRPVTEMPFRGL